MRGRLVASFLVASSALLCLCAPASCAGDVARTDFSWTVMVYMANDFITPLPWEDNINSMEAATQAEDVNILALVDNSIDGDSLLLKVEHDTGGAYSGTIVSPEIDDGGLVIPASGEVNMANSSTLTAFVDFAATEFPADRLVLILWGHGDGWRGLCPDNGDLLTLRELGDALANATADLGRDIDMVVVDACAQATMEMLAELRPHVSYFVGAQNNIPFQGLPYEDILQDLSDDPGQSLRDFGSAIASRYIEYSWYYSPYSATMAVFDLAEVEEALNGLDVLSHQGVKYNPIFHDVINHALQSAEYYDTEWYVDLVDLLSIVHESELPLELRTLALQTAMSFREAVVAFERYDHPDPYDGVSVARANGAVIYAPTTSLFEAEYYNLTISTTTDWDEFGTLARCVMSTEPMVPGPSISYADSDRNGLLDTAFLEWGEDHSLVEAWVFSRLPNGIVFRDSLSSPGSNVSIHGYAGNLVLAASAVDSEGDAVSYTTVNVILYGCVRLEVILMMGGELVEDGLDVSVAASGYSGYAIPSGHVHAFNLTVPTQASVGEMVVVSVMDGQELLLTSRVVIGEHDSRITIQLYDREDPAGADDLILLAFSLAPALLLGIFALLLYVDHRRKNREA